MSALETVQEWGRLAIQLDIPLIKRQHTRDVAFNYYLTTSPGASWSSLAGVLYSLDEQQGLKTVTTYFQRQPGMCGRAFSSMLRN